MEAQLYRALGCAPLTTPEISGTGPVRGWGFCPGSRRPRARVPSVVWACDFLYAGFLPRSPAPCSSLHFALQSATVVSKRMFPPNRQPLGRGPAAEFKPARLKRSEIVSLLGLGPLFAHALLALSLSLPKLVVIKRIFLSAFSLSIPSTLKGRCASGGPPRASTPSAGQETRSPVVPSQRARMG
jgi:hypothetical protein